MVTKEEKFLAHYGVLGMKWGRRKPGTGKASTRKKGSTRSEKKVAAQKVREKSQSPEYKKAQELKKKPAEQLTNEELRSLNNRLNLEKQYTQLTAKQKSEGRKALDQVLKQEGNRIAGKALNDVTNKVIPKIIEEALKRSAKSPATMDPWANNGGPDPWKKPRAITR